MKALAVLVLAILSLCTSAQFTIQPEPVVQAEQLGAEFQCLYSISAGYTWIFNGSSTLPDGVIGTLPTGDTPARLTVPALPQYNNIIVQCEVTVREGGAPRFELSDNAVLIIQDFGPLSINASPSGVVIFWHHLYPPSVNYFVDVRGSDGLIVQSQLFAVNVTNMTVEYTFTSDNVLCELYSFKFTPTDGTRNSSFIQELDLVRVSCQETEDDVPCYIVFGFPLASGCFVQLELTSFAPENSEINRNLTVRGDGEREYRLTQTGLKANQHYTVTFRLNGSAEIIYTQNISTHDIMGASVTPGSVPGSLDISITFVPGTTARGYLAVITRQTCYRVANDTIFWVVNSTSGESHTLEGVGRGRYTVAFFDIERNGLPMIAGESSFLGAGVMVDVNITAGERTLIPYSGGVEFSLDVMENRACVRCSDSYLLLLHSCMDPGILFSITHNETCIATDNLETNQEYSAALFTIDDNRPLTYLPQMVQSFVPGSTAAPTAVPATSTLSIFVGVLLWLIYV